MPTGFHIDRDYAASLDATDALREFRSRFHEPEGTIYLNGNSLGLMPREADRVIERAARDWQQRAVLGWTEGASPWLTLGPRLGRLAAPLVGANPDEVVCAGTTTVNLHALVATFYRPTDPRSRFLIEGAAFPSDRYAIESQIRLRGRSPDEELVAVPTSTREMVEEDEVVAMMDDRVSVAVLPSVVYRTGQLLDIPRLTRAAHERGILIGFDCSHSVGAVPHRFDEWGVDFAVWCGYKYLNGGPGAPAFLYVNRRHFGRTPGMAGWFGYVKERQFDMLPTFEHEPSARGWQISTPHVLSAVPLEAALQVIGEAGIASIREKSLRLGEYLMQLIDALLVAADDEFSVVTPRRPERRGGHIALAHRRRALEIYRGLIGRKVVCDYRPPNLIRLAPSPLYNSYDDVWRAVHGIREVAQAR